MESLLQRQSDIVESIKQIERDYEPSSRKTRKYVSDRLDLLDRLWAEFQLTNDKLAPYFNDTEPYFVGKEFEKTRKYFDSVRSKIASTEIIASTDPALQLKKSQQEVKSGRGNTATYSGGASQATRQQEAKSPYDCIPGETSYENRCDELLSLQRTSFRAFRRLLRSLHVENISDKWELEDELRNIQSRWNAIDSLHIQIDNILQGQDTEYEEEFYAIEESYKAVKRALSMKLASTAHLQQSTPRVEIPTFSGNYLQWPTFYDLYVESIHNNNILTKGQKMQHLKGKLRGEAERIIQHLSITADNYDVAWDLLTHRYNNPQLIFTKQIEFFLNQPNLQKQSASEIKRLFDTSSECIHAIANLGVDTSTWDPLLVHLIVKKLDSETYTAYKEARKAPRELPSLRELMDFLEAKFIALEPIHKRDRDAPTTIQKPYQQRSPQYQQQGSSSSYLRHGRVSHREYQANATYTWTCPLCKQNHTLFKCSKFNKLTVNDKLKTVEKLNVCKNCLYIHDDNICNSIRRCKQCQQTHNTVLHDAIVTYGAAHTSLATTGAGSRAPPAITDHATTANVNKQPYVTHVATDEEEVLLTTLSIKVQARDGSYVTLKALLDQGAQLSIISEHAMQLLGLPRQRYEAAVSGIGNSTKQTKGIVTINCKSIYDKYSFMTKAVIVNKVINNLPNSSFKRQSWPHLDHIQLADPDFNVSKPIDLLLDACIYSDIIMDGIIKGPNTAPMAQRTKLGWILSGNAGKVKTFNCNVVVHDITDMSQYWELEEIQDSNPHLSQDEKYCEQLYTSTTKRLPCGRYEVAIPMKPGFEEKLGVSKSKSVAQFYNLEQKMKKCDKFSESYKQFMREFETLHHMIPVNTNKQQTTLSCYLPHHGVLKLDSTTTRLRTVFNASAKTSTGFSLNDLMERGPNLQKDLQSLVLHWRQHKFVITADIEKMFLQINVRETDQHLQRIVWRYSPEQHLQDYQITKVTFGCKASPFLAMRTLKQLAIDDEQKFPLAAKALHNSFYMDDLISGSNTIEQAQQLQHEIINILKGAGMNIRKWSSNAVELTQNLSEELLDTPLDFKCTESKKTLGLRWNPRTDAFSFQNRFTGGGHGVNKILTKRELLSNILTIFDPLGWLSPLTIRAKLLFQKTWNQSTLHWDTKIPQDMNNEWHQLRQDFTHIDRFKIPRYFGENEAYQLHGFCDASEKSYACTIYYVSRQQNKAGYTSRLVTAKTKLAPTKNKLSLPRLELCGALLLSRLMKKVIESLADKNIQFYAWTDSMVVLGWIHGDIGRWKQFVANRIQNIVELIPPSCWHHVKSAENAADCATRGLTSDQLEKHSLWWSGPEWLGNFDPNRLKGNIYQPPTIEIKKMHSLNVALDHKSDLVKTLLNKNNSLNQAITTICWLKRFINWLRGKVSPATKYLSSAEIQDTYNLIIRTVQSIEFEDEINSLKKHNKVKITGKLACLNPYIDDKDGILRIGGRLNNSSLSPTAKHPAILSSHSRLTELVIQQAHAVTLHGGPRLTLSYIRERYWILSGLRTVKRELRKCVKCRRYSEHKQTQIMADLPKPRVTPSRPFTHTGVDYTGHFDIKANKGRGIKTVVGYVSVFVCLATKAVHLELVSDLTTQGFLAAFRRFCSRRGTPSHMYSDNGTNFVGADRLLKKEYEQTRKAINNGEIQRNLSEQQIRWSFNAPAYPSAGGLWEAAVKSMKYHLRRVVGEQKLTYEEFTTLLNQVEACLNSRPLTELTESPEDEYLTPGHFLIGGPLLSSPQTEPEQMSLTTRWRLVQAMNKQIWLKWSSEYLQSLQTRAKWGSSKPNIEAGDVVIIKEDNLPPGKWALGKVIEAHTGKDGRVRVVTMKTKNGVMKRPIIKLIPLYLHKENQQQKVTIPITTDTSKSDKQCGNDLPTSRRHIYFVR